ncbi:BrnT family toxin [candidate division CSSED10-310 bacterium]|uniref:BrnT family toxin n=1 Tax=candidate division CSSED10-310 bacterium TaxID=2855610 RepID=A0ABV6YUM1_UNCC1
MNTETDRRSEFRNLVGNTGKNWIRHEVTDGESEEIFFNKPLILVKDSKHLQDENRSYVLGRTDRNRLLFVIFTLRDNYIRVISAREMKQKEMRKYYGKI